MALGISLPCPSLIFAFGKNKGGEIEALNLLLPFSS